MEFLRLVKLWAIEIYMTYSSGGWRAIPGKGFFAAS
jgi:hypothetical protein